MKLVFAPLLAVAIVVLGVPMFAGAPVQAQGFPPGSYQRSCNDIHWAGTTLVAECRRRDGRMTGTALPDARRCAGDIADVDGRLQCVAAGAGPREFAPPPPREGYAPRDEPGYRNPGYSGYDERRGRCEEIRHRERELRERLDVAPWEDRRRIEFRLRELNDDREHSGCGR
jgi:hypothetical protein